MRDLLTIPARIIGGSLLLAAALIALKHMVM
jgi:hypothetical protein